MAGWRAGRSSGLERVLIADVGLVPIEVKAVQVWDFAGLRPRRAKRPACASGCFPEYEQ